ncbi:hypothetical protein HDU91_006274 [Kappamyces sp. JEL0680]|nr:hypothetical protein HDU91_006274 [Kappamyces sp. JEL0680]
MPEQPASLFQAFDSHDFANDSKFQGGLTETVADTLQLRHFYYSKFYQPFDLGAFLEWKEQKLAAEKKSQSLSFAEVMDRVQKGLEIPGIRHIPDTLHRPEEASVSTLPPPKKPWEC